MWGKDISDRRTSQFKGPNVRVSLKCLSSSVPGTEWAMQGAEHQSEEPFRSWYGFWPSVMRSLRRVGAEEWYDRVYFKRIILASVKRIDWKWGDDESKELSCNNTSEIWWWLGPERKWREEAIFWAYQWSKGLVVGYGENKKSHGWTLKIFFLSNWEDGTSMNWVCEWRFEGRKDQDFSFGDGVSIRQIGTYMVLDFRRELGWRCRSTSLEKGETSSGKRSKGDWRGAESAGRNLRECGVQEAK